MIIGIQTVKPSNFSIALGETGGKKGNGDGGGNPEGVELDGKWNYCRHMYGIL